MSRMRKIKRIADFAIGELKRFSEDLTFSNIPFTDEGYTNRIHYKAKAKEQEKLGNYFQAASFYSIAGLNEKRDHCLYMHKPEVHPPVYLRDAVKEFIKKPDISGESESIIRL